MIEDDLSLLEELQSVIGFSKIIEITETSLVQQDKAFTENIFDILSKIF